MSNGKIGTVLVAVVVGSVVLAGTALAANTIRGGGAGTQGDLGGDPAVDPNPVVSGNTTSSHLFTFNVQNVSRDGSTDVVRFRFADEMAEAGLSVNNVVVENAETGGGVSVSSSPNLVDGPDGDGIDDTIRLAISPTGGGGVRVNVQADVTTNAPVVEQTTEYDVEAQVEDSAGTTAGFTTFGSVTVEPEGGTTTTTATETSTPTPTVTATETSTPTATKTETPTPTATDTPTDTASSGDGDTSGDDGGGDSTSDGTDTDSTVVPTDTATPTATDRPTTVTEESTSGGETPTTDVETTTLPDDPTTTEGGSTTTATGDPGLAVLIVALLIVALLVGTWFLPDA